METDLKLAWSEVGYVHSNNRLPCYSCPEVQAAEKATHAASLH